MIKKHSLNIQGHQTSVSLEPEFWSEFKKIAQRDNIGINKLAMKIDNLRDQDTGLASAIRLFVLSDLLNRTDA